MLRAVRIPLWNVVVISRPYFSHSQGYRLITDAHGKASDFPVQFAVTSGRGSGTPEAFITYNPTGQVAWILRNGAAPAAIGIQTANSVFDLI